MKKLLALTLSLTLTLSLAAPALAVEAPATPVPEPAVAVSVPVNAWDIDYGAFAQQYVSDYGAAYPDEYAAFDANARFNEEYGGYYTKTEYMEIFDLTTEEDFKRDMFGEFLGRAISADYNAAVVEAYRTAHPGELEAVDVSALLERIGYSDPMTSYMEGEGYTTEAQAQNSLLTGYIDNRDALAAIQADNAAYEADHPGAQAAFDPDAYFQESYGDWWTKAEYMADNGLYSDGEYADSLFNEYVQYQRQNEPVISDEPLHLVANGVAVDAALTAENGVTYAPAAVLAKTLGTAVAGDKNGSVSIREAAAAAGWDVAWNASCNAVVLLDKTAIMAGLGEKFGRMDELLSRLMALAVPKDDGACLTTSTTDLKLTAFNTLDGDVTANATLKAELLQKGSLWQLDLTLNANDLLKLMSDEMKAALAKESPKFTVTQLTSLLTGVKAHLLYDLGGGRLYVNLPILASFDSQIAENTWYSFDLGTAGVDLSAALSDLSVSGVLYQSLLTQSATSSWSTPEEIYASFDDGESQDMLAKLVGNDRVTEKNGTLTYALTTADVNGLFTALDESMPALFKDYHISVAVDQSGKMTVDMALRPDMDAIAGYLSDAGWSGGSFADTTLYTVLLNFFDMRMTAEGEGTASAGKESAQFHWKNQFKLDLTERYTRTKTDKAPLSAPPADAKLEAVW